MLHITSLQVISGRSLFLQFIDGTHAEVGPTAELAGPMFEALLDPDLFQQALLDPGLFARSAGRNAPTSRLSS